MGRDQSGDTQFPLKGTTDHAVCLYTCTHSLESVLLCGLCGAIRLSWPD